MTMPPLSAASSVESNARLRQGLVVLLLILAAALYAPYLNGEFVFDDYVSVLENPSIANLHELRAVLSPPPESTVGGRPFVNLTFAINYYFSAGSAFGYHVFNLAIHLAAILTLYVLIRSLLLSSRISTPSLQSSASGIALVSAGLWGIHPLQSMEVLYISQRSESLMALFYLLALLMFVKSLDSTKARVYQIWSVVFCFLGMACKEVMATAPLTIFILDRLVASRSFVDALKNRSFYYLGLACSILFLGLLWMTTRGRGIGLEYGVTPYKYALTEPRVLLHYLGLIAFPRTLVFDYGLPAYHATVGEWMYVGLLGGVLVVLGFLLYYFPRWAFCAAVFFIILLPSSSFVPVSFQPMAENRIYLPSAAIILFVVIGLRQYIRRFLFPLAAVVFLILGCITLGRAPDYVSNVQLWTDTLAKVPDNARAMNNLGSAQLTAGKLDEARQAFTRALALKPTDVDVLTNLGAVNLQARDYTAAREFLNRALQLWPEAAPALSYLGGMELDTGHLDQAGIYFDRAIKSKPDWPPAWSGKADILLAQNNSEGAIKLYNKALKFDPSFGIAMNNLGNAYLRTGDVARAERCFARAVAIAPQLPKAHANLGTMLARQGKFVAASEQYEEALKRAPDDLETRKNLGLAYQMSGRMSDARKCFESVLAKAPGDPRATSLLTDLSNIESRLSR